jgi:two-component system NtrC family response regulator
MKIERLFEQDHLKKENENLRNELLHLQTGTQILTRNRDMLLILEKVAKLAKTDVPLLVLGESGTGKELVARSLHEFSSRRKGPFVPVNCAALNPGVLESELFGHERGAFTGASTSKTGRIEMANNGTLFLDEIGDVPLEIQVKLLRVLQEQEIERVGGTRRIPVNFRLVTATHRNLEQAIEEERFREDFYYRINVVSVNLPPLRDRPEDIPLLVKFFSEQFARRYHIDFHGITPEAMEQIQKYAFPGNIRELMNIVQRNLVLSGTGTIHQFDLPGTSRPVSARQWLQEMPDLPLPEALEQVEKELIQRALNLASGVQTKAANILGITERNLRYKLKRREPARKN